MYYFVHVSQRKKSPIVVAISATMDLNLEL